MLGPDTSRQLRAYLERRPSDPVSLASMKPWFLAMVVMQLELRRYGYNIESSVDQLFIDRAAGRKKIVALETMDSQLQALDRLPAALQERMLNDELSRIDRLEQDTEDLIEAWRLGDEKALEKLVFRPLEDSPEFEVFYELVFFRRNEQMAIGLENLGRDGRSRFVVIGAGHLLGDRSVPARLAQRGYRIERIRSVSQLARSR
ncbi:MAG: TraB/GumN family protein [Myxococcales bacterium]|nr:TraB/GumN family protein [Myxococcales bacterium]